MSNELVLLLSILFHLGGTVALCKLFGKNGLFVYSVFASIFSSVAACKLVTLFGMTANAGLVSYASTFLTTDILSEKYGKSEAKKAVYYGIAGMALWVISVQLMLFFSPVFASEQLSGQMKAVFGMAPRVFSASMIAIVCSQAFDVFMYHFIWDKTGNNKKMLWLRNNGSTTLSQAIDTAVFVFLAYVGLLPLTAILQIILANYIIKAVVALLDTPFIYWARKIVPLCEKSSSSLPEVGDGSKQQLEECCVS